MGREVEVEADVSMVRETSNKEAGMSSMEERKFVLVVVWSFDSTLRGYIVVIPDMIERRSSHRRDRLNPTARVIIGVVDVFACDL